VKDLPTSGTVASILGLARSGSAVAKLLVAEGLVVIASDIAVNDETVKAKKDLEGLGVEVFLGQHPLDRLRESEFIVVSPGIPDDAPVMRAIQEDNLPIYSELEVASWYATSPIAAVTGTNGKTTTVGMVGHIAGIANLETRVCGNVGNPLSAVCQDLGPVGWLIVEVSSFQLHHMRDFHPKIASILNISHDHLDRYDDFRAYVMDKGKILTNMGVGDFIVYNAQDPEVRSLVAGFQGTTVPFSINETDEGVYLRDKRVEWMREKSREVLFDREDLRLAGDHNLQNAMAAAVMTCLMGASTSSLQEGVRGIAGLAHRLECVGDIRGIRFINDSKATNPGAVKVAIDSIPGKVVLIVGGKEKGLDYSCLRSEVSNKVRSLVAMGECGERIITELGGDISTQVVGSMREAVEKAFAAADEEDTILFSPGTSSFDMYRDYEERGIDFKSEVARLRKELDS
jgi:UDP-N-acetylmuramoylalanine--D-glutamate ligase